MPPIAPVMVVVGLEWGFADVVVEAVVVVVVFEWAAVQQ